MTDGDSEGLEKALADLDQLRKELAAGTNDWTLPVVVRSYDPTADGEEDQKDDAAIFEEHGYTPSVARKWVGNPAEWRLIATYTLPPSAPATPTSPEGSATAAVSPQAIQAAFCPRCGAPRVSGFQFCAGCGLAFDTIGQSPSGAPGGGWTVPTSAPGTAAGTGLKKETLAGAAWLIGALLIGYLAIEQLSVAGTIASLQALDQSLGVTYTGASQSDYQVLALWNGVVAVLTAFAAFRLLRDPSDRDLKLSVTWAVINVVGGIYEVANGVSAAAFLAATVVMAGAGIASFVALQERAAQPHLPGTIANATTGFGLQASGPPTGEVRKCPRCAEQVRADAQSCRYCGYEFPPIDAAHLGHWIIRGCIGPTLVVGTKVELARRGPSITLSIAGRSYWFVPADDTTVDAQDWFLRLRHGQEQVELEYLDGPPRSQVVAALRGQS